MLSNVAAKANVLPMKTYQEELAHISAIELHDIYERCPLLGISFDPARATLTPQQQEEWKARLFWGDSSVSLADDNRKAKWLITTAQEVLRSWTEVRTFMDVEDAIEWLWLCTRVLDVYTKGVLQGPEVEAVANLALEVWDDVRECLNQLGVDEYFQEQRLQEIAGV